MKCIECGKEAEYILNGCSVCQEHYDLLLPIVKKLGELNLAMLNEMKEDLK